MLLPYGLKDLLISVGWTSYLQSLVLHSQVFPNPLSLAEFLSYTVLSDTAKNGVGDAFYRKLAKHDTEQGRNYSKKQKMLSFPGRSSDRETHGPQILAGDR